jgi:hypothetical protein
MIRGRGTRAELSKSFKIQTRAGLADDVGASPVPAAAPFAEPARPWKFRPR